MIPSPETPQNTTSEQPPQENVSRLPGVIYEGPLTEEDMAIEAQIDADIQASHYPSIESIEESIKGEMPELLRKDDWHKQVEFEVALARKENKSYSVALIDLNYFKEVNDTIGHQRGDVVIEDVKKVISGVLRTSDRTDVEAERRGDAVSVSDTKIPNIIGVEAAAKAGHIGGDEFGIAAWTDEEGMETLISRVREAFNKYLSMDENADLRSLGLMGLGVNMSIGSKTLETGMSATELLKAADKAMYRDKESQLPEIKRRQRLCVNASKLILRMAGVRLRDLGKIDQAMTAQRAAKKTMKISRAA